MTQVATSIPCRTTGCLIFSSAAMDRVPCTHVAQAGESDVLSSAG